MNNRTPLLLALGMSAASIFAQTIAPPAIEWQAGFGGTNHDWASTIRQTPDGGYVLAGWSNSGISGNKSSTDFGSADLWIVRMDSRGAKLWERSYGGSGTDWTWPGSLAVTASGGIVVGGESSSAPSGNKTSPNLGEYDFWLLVLDDNGNPLWDRTYGSTNSEELTCLHPTGDGGFILGGSVYTGVRRHDYRVVRTDAQGDAVWTKTLGGDGWEFLFAIERTFDGGYILGGTSDSAPGGDKTGPRFGSAGDQDFWIVRLDGDGNKLWDRSFGGTGIEYLHSLEQTSDGGFILGGSSSSEADGNKTSPGFGREDYWVVRLDGEGNQLWDRSFGGSRLDFLHAVRQTADGGFVLGGWSSSAPDGNKTSSHHGSNDIWIVRLDAAGNKLWEQSYGGSGAAYLHSVEQTTDGGFILGGMSTTGVEGLKTTPAFGDADFWVIKLGPDALSAPPRLDAVAQSAAEIGTNGYRFVLSGISNQTYVIETSPDAIQWTPLQTNRLTGVEAEMFDAAATNFTRRFYRTRAVPPTP